MKTPEQLAASIDRFRCAFWERRPTQRPPVGVAAEANWLPVTYLQQPFTKEFVAPLDVTPDLALPDYAAWARRRAVYSDDFLPFAAAWRAVPWLEAICGCPVRFSPGSLAPVACVDRTADLAALQFPARNDWRARLLSLTEGLVATTSADCWVAPTILRGSSDVLNALRGTDFFLDLFDDAASIAEAAPPINRALIDVLRAHFAQVPPRLGGYSTFYGYWAPGPTAVIQEDAMGLCHPRWYRDIFAPLTADVVAALGEHIFFHLHSTGMCHYRDVLAIPGLAGLELTVEAKGPLLSDLCGPLAEILARTRLILFIDGHLYEVAEVLRSLPRDGLYIIVPEHFIADEDTFYSFLTRCGYRSHPKANLR